MNQNLWNYKPKINHSFFKLLWFLSLFSFIYILCVWVFVCLSVHHTHSVSERIRRGLQISQDWNPWRQLLTSRWVLGVELRSSGRAVSALIHRAIVPAPIKLFRTYLSQREKKQLARPLELLPSF